MAKTFVKSTKQYLNNRLLTQLCGLTMGEWLAMLRRHRFAVDPVYYPRAALITLLSGMNSAVSAYEDMAYGAKLDQVAVKQPTFILGHMRSGTTFLNHLLAIDKRFAYPKAWDVFNPHTMLTTEPLSALLRMLMPSTREMDNVRMQIDNPFEDRMAGLGCMCSPALRLVFPRHGDNYERYLTMRDVPPQDVARWKRAQSRFYQKLTLKYRKPLLLKSPQHTAHVRLLLEMFPDARFIHIYRNPYAVFRSTYKVAASVSPTMRLQDPAPWDVDGMIIRRYQTIFDAYFEDRKLIPEGQLVELRFEDLEQDPVGSLRNVYQTLSFPDFGEVEQKIKGYVDSLGYKKNRYTELPIEQRQRLSEAWRRNFELWGYPCEEQQYAAAAA